jgi:hypothetical protein
MCAHDRALTPCAVESLWEVERMPVCGKEVQVCTASTKLTASQVQLQSAAPVKLALVGLAANNPYGGVYTKKQRRGILFYEGGWDAEKMILGKNQEVGQKKTWLVGNKDNVQEVLMYAQDLAEYPDSVTQWRVPQMTPCSSVRVIKSKKKRSTTIEVKGIPTHLPDRYNLAQYKGKYKQQTRLVGGRATFKGGQDGQRVLWYDDDQGKWRARGGDHMFGCGMEATDTAATPDAVKTPWSLLVGSVCSPFPNVIVPSVESAEEEVLRLMQLKLLEAILADPHMRCLGCGKLYHTGSFTWEAVHDALHDKVMFQSPCMHHHCACCGDEVGVCAVCAEQECNV